MDYIVSSRVKLSSLSPEALRKHNKRLKQTLDLLDSKTNPGIVQVPTKARASQTRRSSKADKAPTKTYQVPPSLLPEFLASGLTPTEFLAQPRQAIANHSVPTLELKKRKLSGSVYRPDPVEAIPRNQLERNVIEAYCKQVKGVTEVPTDAGRIDFLSESELIEFKLAHNWKHALGQLLVYGFYYPNHDLVLMLVGSRSKYYCQEAKKHCSRFNVTVRQASN